MLKENPDYLAHALTCKEYLSAELDVLVSNTSHPKNNIIFVVIYNLVQKTRMVVWSLYGDFFRPIAKKEVLLLTKRIAELQFAACQRPANFLRENGPITKMLTCIST